MLLFGAAQTHAQSVIKFDVAALSQSGWSVDNLSVVLDVGQRAGTIQAGRVVVGTHEWRNLALECTQLELSDAELSCGSGRLQLPDASHSIALSFNYVFATQSLKAALRPAQGGAIELNWPDAMQGGELQAHISDFPIQAFASLLPAEWVQVGAGIVNAQLVLQMAPDGMRVDATGDFSDLGFSSPDGLQAMEGVGGSIALNAIQKSDQVWHSELLLSWELGAAYWHPVYLEAGAQLALKTRLTGAYLEVSEAELRWPGVERIAAQGRWNFARAGLENGVVSVSQAQLSQLGPQFVIPLLLPGSSKQLELTGGVNAELRVEDFALKSLAADLQAVSVDFDTGRLRFGPISGEIPWHRNRDTRVRLNVGGGQWERLALGAFELELESNGFAARVADTHIPVLDGQLSLSGLQFERKDAGWYGGGEVVLEPVSMKLLSTALGLPEMSGVVSASLPGLSIEPGLISLDGTVVITLFDGYLHANGFQLIEPFGIAPHLSTHLEVRNLDLYQLTETFSFGSVKGFIDADIRNLELVNWRPVHFDANVRSSPGRYERRISQRAVQNIGALGGPGASLAIQRGVLGFFESFGYRNIGWSCALRDGVCEIAGIPGQDKGDGGFVLIQGGGVPALNVIGYNRRIDWDELLARLAYVIESNAAPVIE